MALSFKIALLSKLICYSIEHALRLKQGTHKSIIDITRRSI